MTSPASFIHTRRLVTVSIVARLPLAMLSIGLLVHAQHVTGSLTQGGVVTGTYAITVGVGGPLVGRLVDHRGQALVLLITAGTTCLLLLLIAALPASCPLIVLVALTAGVGLATPPIGACLRTQLPALLSDPSATRRAYALEATLVELTYITGPPLALCIGELWSSGAALAVCGLALLTATAAFAAQPGTRGWQPGPASAQSETGSSLRAPAMRTLALALLGVGVLLGADEVAVIATAKALHTTVGAAPLFAVWGIGSFVGGLLITRHGGGARTARGLALLLGALTVGHLALIPADGKMLALGAVLFLAGTAIAPTEATLYAMVNHASPHRSLTEAFAWLATAMAVGNAAGSASAGFIADHFGPSAAFALAGSAGLLALLTTMLRSRTIGEPPTRNVSPSKPRRNLWQLGYHPQPAEACPAPQRKDRGLTAHPSSSPRRSKEATSEVYRPLVKAVTVLADRNVTHPACFAGKPTRCGQVKPMLAATSTDPTLG